MPVLVSIIICTFERTADLLLTLESIRNADLPVDISAELIVVDSSRTDEARRALGDEFTPILNLPLRVLHEPRRGKANALNTAMANARGDILLFTDDDVRVPTGWIAAMTGPIQAGAADAVAGGIHLAPDLRRPWMEPFHRGWMASTEVLNSRAPEALIGANMAFARHVLDRVPMFDPELGSGSDLGGCDESLFSFQLRAAGYRLVSAFECSVEHRFDPARLQQKCFLERAKIEGRSAAYIAHHWKQETPPARPRFERFRVWCKLVIKRWYKRPKWSSAEGAPVWMLQYLIRLNFLTQHLHERRRVRNYAKRGLTKLGLQPPAGTGVSPQEPVS